MEGLGPVAAAAAAFVGTHFLLSHPLRKPVVDTVGSVAFLGELGSMVSAFRFITVGNLRHHPSTAGTG